MPSSNSSKSDIEIDKECERRSENEQPANDVTVNTIVVVARIGDLHLARESPDFKRTDVEDLALSNNYNVALSNREKSGFEYSSVNNFSEASNVGKGRKNAMRRFERVEYLARPAPRRLRELINEKCGILPPDRRDKIKSSLEEDYFLSPEQTEQYFQTISPAAKMGLIGVPVVSKKEQEQRQKELKQRQQWLINFSAQVAYRICDYIAKGQKEMLVSNRLRAIADVVLERVAEILGEPKPSRSQPSRLARFMIAISDRIAVWIENAVYRADAQESISCKKRTDSHMNLDGNEDIFV